MSDRIEALGEALADLHHPATVHTPAGPVLVEAMALRSIGEARWVEVTVASPEGGDPTFRIFNPPADPAEVAHAVALHGGRHVERGRR